MIRRRKLLYFILGAVIATCGCDSIQSLAPRRTAEKTQDIASGKVHVELGKVLTYRINVRPEMIEPSVKCSFQASGGSGNDVEVALADEANTTNWINGHQSQLLWSTPGQLTTGSFDLKLEPGIYYLVISNKFSIISDKDVAVDAKLNYRQVE